MSRRSSRERTLRRTLRGVEAAEPGRSWPLRIIQRSLGTKKKPRLAPPNASASILLISPRNQILLLQRVSQSTSFKNAHVFPGGHVDEQDGPLPPIDKSEYHEDSSTYRYAAIRECFEETGILLARPKTGPFRLIELDEQQNRDGRHTVHSQGKTFKAWLEDHDAVADTENLIPFTRWLTPGNISKRYSTQMYIYFLPIENSRSSTAEQQDPELYIPTPDGGIEHVSAEFHYASEWLDMSLRKEIILFPPQFVLLSLVAQFTTLKNSFTASILPAELLKQRSSLQGWLETDGEPSWAEKCISPDIIKTVKDKCTIMGLERPGPELEGTQRKGDSERVVKVLMDDERERGQQRPQAVELCWKQDLLPNKQKTAKM